MGGWQDYTLKNKLNNSNNNNNKKKKKKKKAFYQMLVDFSRILRVLKAKFICMLDQWEIPEKWNQFKRFFFLSFFFFFFFNFAFLLVFFSYYLLQPSFFLLSFIFSSWQPFVFQKKKWYMVSIVHECHVIKTSVVNIFVNGKLVNSSKLRYPYTTDVLLFLLVFSLWLAKIWFLFTFYFFLSFFFHISAICKLFIGLWTSTFNQRPNKKSLWANSIFLYIWRVFASSCHIWDL